MNPPRLLAGKRWPIGLALGVVALAQAGLAAAFSEAIGSVAAGTGAGVAGSVTFAFVLALAMGAAMLAERSTAERFAQSFVLECRARLFDAVIRNRGKGNEARWLGGLVGDLSALRNYAMRGSVRLWTSLLAGAAAGGWLVYSAPRQGMVLLPFIACLVLLMGITILLRRTIARQRGSRGRLNRFVLRRVRIEMAGAPCPRGHGIKRLGELSGQLRSDSERRAFVFGSMEFLASLSGGLAVLLLVMTAPASQSNAVLVGQISLVGFIAARMLETARALHARAGGHIALGRLANMLGRDPSGRSAAKACTQPESD
jgi:hypothetical protein